MIPSPEIVPVVIAPSQVIGAWTAALTSMGLMLTSLGTLLTAIFAFFNLMHARDNTATVQGLRIEINHRMDQLLAARQAEGHAAGVQEERAVGLETAAALVESKKQP